MPHNVAHFSIHAGDVERARRFYQAVFGCEFEAWGPPDFYRIRTANEEDPGIHGALQKRNHPIEGRGMIGYECTIAVESLDEIAVSIEQHGGKITMPKSQIEGVGWLVQFEDTEGNIAFAMRYD